MRRFKSFSFILALICLVPLFCLNVSAAQTLPPDGRIFNISAQRPQVTDRSGYIEVMYYTDSSRTTFTCEVIEVVLYSNISSNYNSNEQFTYTPDYNIFCKVWLADGFISMRGSSLASGSDNTVGIVARVYRENVSSQLIGNIEGQIDYATPYQNIASINYYGSIFNGVTSFANQLPFVVNYSSDGVILNALNSMNEHLFDIESYSSAINTAIQNINVYTVHMSSVLDNMNTHTNLLTYIRSSLVNVDNLLTSIDSSLKSWSNNTSQSSGTNTAPIVDSDGTIDEIERVEQEALGNKTQEEIVSEIEDTVDLEQQLENVEASGINQSNIAIVGDVFNLTLDSLGPDWKTFFILSLVLGFACYLIGRRV